MIGGPPAISRDPGGRRAARAVGWLPTATMLCVVGSLTLWGCGATGAPVVASVQGSTISQVALAHWMAIERIELQGASKPASTPSSLLVRQRALAFLITADWLEKEAAAQGVSVSASEVNATYQLLLSSPAGQAFAASLKRGGISSADELLLLRLRKLALKLQTKIAASYHGVSAAEVAHYYHTHAGLYQRQGRTLPAATRAIREILVAEGRRQRFRAFEAAYSQRWKQRTTCQPGYVIAECRNGPPLP